MVVNFKYLTILFAKYTSIKLTKNVQKRGNKENKY